MKFLSWRLVYAKVTKSDEKVQGMIVCYGFLELSETQIVTLPPKCV